MRRGAKPDGSAVTRLVRTLLPILLLCLAAPATAQTDTTRVVIPGDRLGVWSDTLDVRADVPDVMLRPFVRPETLVLTFGGDTLDASRFTLDAASGRVTLTPPASGRLVAEYRTWPFENLAGPIVLRDSVEVSPATAPVRTTASDPLLGSTGLQTRGAIRRGVVAGNRRDVSLESGLRLEIDGEVADGVTLRAVLSDENTPITPDGTTQRLADLDRVYVEIDAPRASARLGDVDLRFDGTAFAPLTRTVQGATASAELPAVGAFAGGTVTAAGAVSRGLFRSQDLVPLDGVQGPYRLTGQNGEELILVLAGSERVYLDGVLLTRGQANDYVIDYATGEITFTPRRLITSDRRLTVDFEYTTGSFTRALAASEVRLGFAPRADGRPRVRFQATVLREADGQAFADELGLTEADLDRIAEAGPGLAFRSGADAVPFDPESPFVLYAERDTTVAGETVRIFVPATPADSPVFRVRFSRVEPGTGSYVRSGQAVNGIVYEWIGPTGGDYLPIRLLPRPERRQLVDVAASAELAPGVEVFGEAAHSGFDVNRLSDDDATDRTGGAFLGGLRIADRPLFDGTLSAEVTARRRGATFTPFARIRPVEFNRTWNLARSGSAALEGIREDVIEGVARWRRDAGTMLAVEAGRLDLGDVFDGRRAAVEAAAFEPGWPTLTYRMDVVEADNALANEQGVWLRQRGRLGRVFGRVEPFVEVEHERRAQRLRGTDSLAFDAIAFVEARPGVTYADDRLGLGASVGFRREELPLDGRFAEAANAVTVALEARYRPDATLSTEVEAAVRRRTPSEAFELRGDAETESVALRGAARWTPLDRALDINALYSAASERAPILQEAYIRVGPELGEYVWEDLNGDGIQQLDEFREQITPLEGEYLRVFLPGDELRAATNAQAQLRVQLAPERLVGSNPSGWRRTLAAFGAVTTVDVQERSESPDRLGIYLLRPSALQNLETTLNGRLRLAQEVTILRGNPVIGGRIAASHLRTTARLASGADGRRLQRLEAEVRGRPAESLSLRLRGLTERNDAESERASRRHAIRLEEIEPEATWRLSDALSVTGGVRLGQARDADTGAEATLVIIPLQVRLATAGRFQLLARAERADVRLDGPVGFGQARFELTQRRGVGTSYLGTATAQAALTEVLRGALTVEARAPEAAPVQVSVRVQLSAVF